MNKQFIIISLSLLLVVILALGACAKATTSTTTTVAPKPTTSPPPTAQPTTSAPATTAKPAITPATTTTAKPTPTINKYGGKFTLIWNDTAPLMGYPATNSGSGDWYGGLCIETLLMNTLTPYVYDPNLVVSWQLAPDKSTYIFKLRQGVKFSDGTEMKAKDVKFAIDNAIATKRSEVTSVKSCDIIDDYTIRVNLSTWNALTLGGIGGALCAVISTAAFEKNGQDWAQLNPIGTGPFILKEMVQSQYTKYVKNPNYWDKGYPYLDAVDIIAVKDMMTRQAMLLNGDADGAREMDGNTAKNIVNTGKFIYEAGAMGNFVIFGSTIDTTNVWAKQNMRFALEYALDKQLLSDALGQGFTNPSYEVISGVWEVSGNNPGTTPRKYDPTKAQQLMKEAGYGSGLKTTMELNQKFNSDFVVAIQNQLSKVGINVQLEVIADSAYQSRKLVAPAPGVLRYERARGGPSTLLTYVNSDLATASIWYPGVKRPAGWDDMLNQAMLMTDGSEIMKMMNKMEQIAYSEAMLVPVFTLYNVNVWSPKLRNDRGGVLYYAGTGSDTQTNIKYMWWTK